MAILIATELERVFYMESQNIELPDPDPSMLPDQVLQRYVSLYPELATSTVIGPEYRNDQVVYTIKTVLGVKG